MPKRKVTFQGVGNEEEEEDAIGVPKKKVRRLDSYVLGGVKGRKRELEARSGETFEGEGKGKLFHVF